MIETDVGQGAGGSQVGQPVLLTQLQVTDCFRMVMDLVRAQHTASCLMNDFTETLPQNLHPEHQCSIAFLASAIAKVDEVLGGVVEELEVLRATIGRAGGENTSSLTAARANE